MTQRTDKRERKLISRPAPQTVQLGGSDRAQLKETEKHLLQTGKITPRDCKYLNGCEIAEVLMTIL